MSGFILSPKNQRQSIIGCLNMAFKCRRDVCFYSPNVGAQLRKGYRMWLETAREKRLSAHYQSLAS